MQLEATFSDDQCVNSHLFRFAVNRQLEPIREHRLQHQVESRTSILETKATFLIHGGIFRFSLDIVTLGIDPARRTRNLGFFYVECFLQQKFQRDVFGNKPRANPERHSTVSAVIRLDGDNFECRAGHTRFRRRLRPDLWGNHPAKPEGCYRGEKQSLHHVRTAPFLVDEWITTFVCNSTMRMCGSATSPVSTMLPNHRARESFFRRRWLAHCS